MEKLIWGYEFEGNKKWLCLFWELDVGWNLIKLILLIASFLIENYHWIRLYLLRKHMV